MPCHSLGCAQAAAGPLEARPNSLLRGSAADHRAEGALCGGSGEGGRARQQPGDRPPALPRLQCGSARSGDRPGVQVPWQPGAGCGLGAHAAVKDLGFRFQLTDGAVWGLAARVPGWGEGQPGGVSQRVAVKAALPWSATGSTASPASRPSGARAPVCAAPAPHFPTSCAYGPLPPPPTLAGWRCG